VKINKNVEYLFIMEKKGFNYIKNNILGR